MNKQAQRQEPVNPWFVAEFSAWTMVALAPFLTWVNGPSVSTDQFVVRTSVFTLALVSAVTLRIGKIVCGRNGSRQAPQ
jgi:hypothetical protein